VHRLLSAVLLRCGGVAFILSSFAKGGDGAKAVVSKASRRRRKRTQGRNSCKKSYLFTYIIKRKVEGAREVRGKRNAS